MIELTLSVLIELEPTKCMEIGLLRVIDFK